MALMAMSGRGSRRKESRHGRGYKCTAPSSPLVEALAIDFFNDGYHGVPKKSPTYIGACEQYVNYMSLSCEDVDCMECRAYRLGLDFQGVASCPSLLLKMGQDVSDTPTHRGSHSVLTASCHRLCPQMTYSSVPRECYRGTASSFLPSAAFSSADHDVRKLYPYGSNRNEGVMTYPAVTSPRLSTTAQHRRRDFKKRCSRWPRGPRENYSSASVESSELWKSSVLWASGTTDSYTSSSAESNTSISDLPVRSSPAPARPQRNAVKPSSCTSSNSQHKQQSPAGFRRKSFLAAVDKSKGDKADFSRRGSYRAAIDPRYLAGQAGQADLYPEAELVHSGDGGQGSGQGLMHSDGRLENKTVTFQLDSEDERNGNILVTDQLDCSGSQKLGTQGSVHGSPSGSASHSHVTAEDSGGLTVPPAQPTCTADNMPAHFKHKTSPAATTQDNAASTSTVTTTTAATVSSILTTLPLSTILVPGSPPPSPRAAPDSQVPAVPSRLARLRQSNLSRKRGQMKASKMPELSEHLETSEADVSTSSPHDTSPNHSSVVPHVSVTSPDPGDVCGEGGSGEEVVRPPSPSDEAVTPSLPDSFLKKLGLLVHGQEKEPRIDQLPDKQIENRFNSLSLAFKTDRLTLDKRLGIQERARDIAEQNIDKELQGLRDALELLDRLCGEESVQEVMLKIRHHLEVLEQSIARVSSRAEVFGAVQMEKRMCLAMEVMIACTENIRRLREKEQAEVEEARKVLHDRHFTAGHTLDPFYHTGPNNAKTRRRSEVALPRVFGGSGTPSLHFNSSMDSTSSWEMSQSAADNPPSVPDSAEEPRQRFQTATASISVMNLVTNKLQRNSLERQKRLSQHSSSSAFSNSSRNSSIERSQDKDEETTAQTSAQDEAFRHGYEEGLKANATREMTAHQGEHKSGTSSHPAETRERADTPTSQHKEEPPVKETPPSHSDVLTKVRQWLANPDWTFSDLTLRKVAAGIICLFALVVVVVTFVSSSEVSSR